MKKEYQNIGSQMINLQKNKNVEKNTIIRKSFDEKTYLDLVNPYSDLIAIGRSKSGKHIYPDSVDFGEYIEFNRIDEAISDYLRALIGPFEKMLKNFLMHKYCSKMKESGDKRVNNYAWVNDYISGKQAFDLIKLEQVYSRGTIVKADLNTKNRRKKVLKTIADINSLPSKNNMVCHYQTKYGYVPMFVAIHSLSMGQLITLFSILPRNDKEELLKIFNGTADKHYSDNGIEKFEKDMIRIQVIRNIVNHYEPIFPFIQNTEYKTFGSLTDLLIKLKRYYFNCVTFPQRVFKGIKTARSKSAYSLEFHKKIERVIGALS